MTSCCTCPALQPPATIAHRKTERKQFSRPQIHLTGRVRQRFRQGDRHIRSFQAFEDTASMTPAGLRDHCLTLTRCSVASRLLEMAWRIFSAAVAMPSTLTTSSSIDSKRSSSSCTTHLNAFPACGQQGRPLGCHLFPHRSGGSERQRCCATPVSST